MDFFDSAAAAGGPSPSTSSISLSSSRKRLKLSLKLSNSKQPEQSKWRTAAQERVYSRRLLDALRSTTTTTTTAPPPLEIKDAADSALAMTARGQTRWSRAILSRRWRMRKVAVKAGRKVVKRRRKKTTKTTWLARRKEVGGAGGGGEKKKVKERLRFLARIVPGCRKASTPCLLEEAADYVAALQLQVKAMKALADALSSSSSSSSSLPSHT